MFDFLKGFGASCRVSGGSKITSAGRAIEGFGIDMQSKGWLTRFSMVNLTIFLCDRQCNPIINNAILQATGKPALIDGEAAIKAVLANPFDYTVKISANDVNNVTSVEAAKKFQADFDAICGIQPAQPQAQPQPQAAPQQPQPQAQVQPQAQPQPQAAQTPQPQTQPQQQPQAQEQAQQPSWEPVSVKDIDLNDYEPTC